MIGNDNRKTVLCGMDTSSYDDVEQTDETTMTISPIGSKIPVSYTHLTLPTICSV